MKLHANMYHVNKQPSLEDGTMKYEIMDENCTTTIDRKSNRCNRWLQLMKVILYIELILFIGWIGCVFITNYYQPHNFNGTVEQHGASKWTQEPERSTNQDDFETTTVKSQTPPKFVSETKNVESHVEIATTTEIIEPDERDEKPMVQWMHSWAKGRGSWDDSSSESSSSQDKLDWDPAEKGAFNRNTDEAASIANHFGVTNEDDELELNYLLTFPLWHNVIFTSDSLAESVDSDKDSFDESTEDYGRSRQTRSADDESSSSSSSSSEESNKPGDGPDAANGESSKEDECATVVDDDGNVTNEAKDGNDWVSLLKEADIPDCEKSKVAKSVTVDRCGKIVVKCVDDEKDDTPMKHHRRTRNTETKNAAVESCKQRFTLWLKNLQAWKAWIVQEGSAGQMVQEVYQNIQEHVRMLIGEAIDDRTSGKPRKTEEDWRNSLISMKRNIAKSIDSEGRNLFVNDNELTSKMGASLGEIVETAVDIRMDCHEILSTLSPTLDTMTKEQKNCHQAAETMTLFDNKFAAEVVPGDATNPEVRGLRRLFKPHALVLVFDIIQYKNTNVPSGMSRSLDLTEEQLTSYIRGLKGKMLHFANYTSLRTQLEDRLLPTAEETNLLREMVNYYSRVSESCSMAHLEELMMALNTRKTRAVSMDPPTVFTCTLDHDDVEYMQERKERFERYDQSVMVNMGLMRIRPLLDVIEERMNGTAPTESSDADIKPDHMSYIRALNVFMGNTSTELKNEGYRLFRDIVLESKYLEVNETATEGYSLDAIMQNWTVSCLMHIDDNYTAETILMAIIKLGEALNLHYMGAEENKNCGEAFTPVYGSFTYVGEEPQKSIVRKWRHIFEGIVKLYFAIRNPKALSYCTNDQEFSEASTVPTCGSADDLAQFHQERQERLDRYNQADERTMSESRIEPFLDAIQERLNGVNSTADSDDKPVPPYMRYMNIVDVFTGNSSTDLKNDGYRLLQDIILESKYMDDNAPAAMEGYSIETITEAWVTNCLKDIGENYTAEMVLIAAMKFAEGMDLQYSGLESGKKCGEPFTPTYGTFTYVGQAPEKSLVRRWRHMLNAMARLYFKMYNPEVLPKLNCKEESRTTETNTGEVVARMGKRSIGHPSRRSASDITCTSDDDDAQFMQERKERFEHYDQSVMVNMGTMRMRPFLDAIEERMNGTAPTESSDEDIKPVYMSYLKALNVFMGNTSTELKNDGYRLLQDIVLESKYLEDNETATEGYNLDTMMQNWTVSCLMHIDNNYTAETILMAVIKLGETLDLHYTGAEENKNCGEAFTPVYGSFTYVGEEPQKSIVRKWRHIFEGIVKLYFAIRNPEALASCTNDKGGESSTTATCGSEDDLAQFDQERQERFERYYRADRRAMSASRTEPFLDTIQERLNGVNSTADSDDKPAPTYMRYMNIFDVFVGNSSTDLKNDGYRLLQDIILESKYMDDNAPAAMEGYSIDTIMEAWMTNCLQDIGENYTAEMVLIAAMKFAEGLDLNYSGLDSGKKCSEPFTPTYGTFTYVGQAPEKSLVRRWRHMLNAMARLYFKMYNPEVLPKLNCKEESRTPETNTGEVVARMGKRSIGHRSRRSASDITCTSDDDDAQFMQERKERLERYEQSVSITMQNRQLLSLLDTLEERLNGTAPTEISDEHIQPANMPYIKALNVFMGNTSIELKNEGYRLLRDMLLEAKYLEHNETATEGYDLDAMMRNWTGSCLMHFNEDYTAETILMAVIKLGATLDLHYTGAEENKNCGDEFTPVWGTFSYVGEEPEKSIVRKWRHIFGSVVKLYFDIHNPEALAPCTNDKEGSESSTTTTCISKDDIAQFDQERQERLDRYNEYEKRIISDSRTEPFLDAIEEKMNGVTATEDSDDKPAPPFLRYMNILDVFTGNSSADLKNEVYRLVRDIILESKYMDDNAPAAMEGYSIDTIMEAWMTNCLQDIGENYTAETVLIAAMKFAEGMDLHYSGLDSGKKCSEPFTPTYGTFTYVGQAPEKSLVRRWRHMLNAMTRLYFKMYNPEVLPKLNCKEESRTTETNTGEVVARMGKRSIGHPSRRSASDITCTSDDDDVQFIQERKERLDRYSQSVIMNMGNTRIHSLLDTIKERLNGTVPTESSEEDTKPAYMPYIKALNVFMGNTSTELKNEGYMLLRDIVLESKYLEDNETATEGYDLDAMMQNWTGSCLMHFNEDYTAENILMAVIKLGETLDLHYTGAEENKNCGDEFTPVWGTFTYVGEEPEKSIVRKWKHIFGSVVKLYFDIHNPEALAPCTNDKDGSESSTTTTCISKDDIAEFDQERQERLDRYNEYEKRIISDSRTEPILDAIEEKLNGVTSTEDSDEKPAPPYLRYMNIFNVFIGHSSTDLKNEGYRLLRDIVLELKYMDDNKPAAMEGYSIDTIMEAWMTNCLQDIGDNYTAEMVLVAAMKVAEGIDLHYSGLDSGKKCGEQFTPAYGKFTYVGQAPEKSLVQRWRHILNAMARLYFKMNNPEVLPKLNCKEESRTTETNTGEVVARMGKRSIGHPSRRTDNSVDVDEKYIGNDNNGRLIKMSLDPDAEPWNFDLSQDSFIDKMEMLSAHIDRLHDMYQRYNELNDDYVSEEFPVDPTSNHNY